MKIEPESAVLNDYHSLVDGLGYLALPHTLIELTGTDRMSFLNNFCTNDIVGLIPGRGCEAFLTNVQGKIMAHVFVFCHEDRLIIATVSGQADTILPHLDRYLIREDVQLNDQSKQRSVTLLSGTKWATHFEPLFTEDFTSVLQCMASEFAGIPVELYRVEMTTTSSLLLVCDSASQSTLEATFRKISAHLCSEQALTMARIEAGWPQYGIDISDTNFPQEIGRDHQAICFTKGCYLGQETVARIDALGHVNWNLVGLQFESEAIPSPGMELIVEQKTIGHVTSATHSPCLAAPLALAYVRREHQLPGCQLNSKIGSAKVVTLPIAKRN